ncbi:RagB/SusD family nutrient uptake outer membrane protein [Prolixibacteraceae bacterium JC049]|nr:RagB/SusD family nutrient uptake outer membrane protein [Prolixibacteraceae bacterium JC049]
MKRILYIIIAAMALTACGDDFFQTAPQDKLSDLSFWKTEKDFTYAVNALYPYMEGAGNIALEVISDNAVRNQNWYADYEVANGSGTDENSIFLDEWKRNYEGIARANAIIEKIQSTEIDAEVKKKLVAQARFFRAYLHFRLAFLYTDVPLLTQPISIEEGRVVSKTAQAEVYNFVFTELNAIENDLPASYPAEEVGRITKGAVQALKARFYLYTENWSKAAEEAQKVMNSNNYSLHNNYSQLFLYPGENSAEHILQHQYVRDAHECGTFGYAPIALGGGSRISPLRELYDAYLCTDGLSISASPLYNASNSAENRDPRLAATLLLPGTEFGGMTFSSLDNPDSPDYRGKGFDATRTGLNLKKHINTIDKEDSKKSHCDFSVIRFAEILLTYAEAKTELNQIDNSVYAALNQIRQRVNMPDVKTGKSQDQLRQTIRLERRVELAFEGQRFWDIRRWRIAENVMNGKIYGLNVDNQPLYVATRTFNSGRDYHYPIPRKEFELNKNLLPQNSGY